MDEKKEIIHITLRVSKELHKRIKSAAEDDLRSMNTYIVKLVEDHLNKKENK